MSSKNDQTLAQKFNTQIDVLYAELEAEGLSELTEAQRTRFYQIYPGGVPKDKRLLALDQIWRTILKNRG